MRLTLVGSPTNYGTVGLRYDAEAEYAEIPIDEHFEGRLRRDELTMHEVEVPEGLAALAIRLSWRHDWTRWPTYDLDLFVEGPDGIVPVASLDSPELAWIENPAAGAWKFWIQDLGTVIHREPYALDLGFVSSKFVPEIALDDSGAERARVTGAQPNPTTSSTAFSFALPVDVASADLAVFDVTGRRVRQLVHGPMPAGAHEVTWDGRSGSGERVAAGIYFVKLETPRGSSSRKVLLLK
jgi:hypothetical protein